MQNTNLSPDEELNLLICGTSVCFIIYLSYKLLKMVRFWPTLCLIGVTSKVVFWGF